MKNSSLPLPSVRSALSAVPYASMKFFNNRWFLFALRILLGGVFLYAGTTKLLHPQSFADSIASFKILPPQLINIVALGLPPFEILLGLMLISGWKSRAASLAVAGLAIVFGLALGQALVRGLEVDCGCFGSGQPSVFRTWLSFGRAGVLCAVGLWLYNRLRSMALDNSLHIKDVLQKALSSQKSF